MTLVDEDLTYELRGCFFDVQNQLGFGLPEEAYHQGLIRAFAARGIPARSKVPVWLTYRDLRVVELIPDFVVADRVVLELKALRGDFAREHEIQLFSYLKATKIRVGFLVSFGGECVHVRRRVFDEKPLVTNVSWGAVEGRNEDHERNALDLTRSTISTVAQLYGLGFGEEVYWKLLAAVLRSDGHGVNHHPRVKPCYDGQRLGDFPVDCAVIDESIVCVVTALKERLTDFDLARAVSYTQNLQLRLGMVANFGKDNLELKAFTTVC